MHTSDATSPLPLGYFPRAPRVSLDETVMFKPERRQNIKGLVRDISVSGAYLVSPEQFRAGTELLLYLHLPFEGRKKLCIISASISRIEKKPDTPLCGYGVAFGENLPLSSKEALDQFVTYKETGVAPQPSALQSLQTSHSSEIHIETKSLRTPPEFLLSETEQQKRAQARLETFRKRKKRNQIIFWVGLFVGLLFFTMYF